MRPSAFRNAARAAILFAGTAMVAFAVTPVGAKPLDPKPPWGDIYSVNAGPGLAGGAAEGDAVLSVLFGGNGTANSVARSDHNHDDRYALLGHNHDDRYMPLGANFDDRYMPLGKNFDTRYAPIGINFDDRYMPLGTTFDSRYLQLTGGTLSGNLSVPGLASTAPEGTAPLEVGSSTLVTNLNADRLDGHDASDFALTSQLPPGGNYATLGGDNAFTGANTFNAASAFGGPVRFTTGSASFTWQPFYTSPTAYQLRLIDSFGGPTRLVLDQNGRIGIGTTSPAYPLHVVGDIRATNLNLGTSVLSPLQYDMSSSSDKTFSILNSNGGVGHLSVEGMVSAAGFSIATTGAAARAGNDAVTTGNTTRGVSTTAVGSNSLIFVTQDASRSGCAHTNDDLYVSARNAGSGFTVATSGPAPAAGQSYCFSWWVMN